MKNCNPTYDELKSMINTCHSILSASKKYIISRKKLTKLLEEYDLKPNYFVNKDVKNELAKEQYKNMSPKEIALALNVKVETVKYYKKDFVVRVYDKIEIIDKIKKYNYNLENQGLVKQIKYDDKNLYDSIIEHTRNHLLESNKLTERLYRIYHNYSENSLPKCTYCDNNLKFYTFKLGYGNSDNLICKNCNQSLNGVSLISQKLFWEIYKELNEQKKKNCKFSQLNNEKKIYVSEEDHNILKNKKINKKHYYFDFICDNKIIEFDGAYYHKDAEKELAKDLFANYKGFKILHIDEIEYKKNPEKIIEKCLTFLNQ